MPTLDIRNMSGKKVDSLEVSDKMLTKHVNSSVLHQAVVMYQASLRQGNASTKTRKEVSGGGIKPWRQKGTGRARAGSIRSPLWQGGGVVFGPHPRDFGYSLPQKMRSVALRESINAKYHAKQLTCIEDIKEKVLKTKEFAKMLAGLELKQRVLALLDGSDESVYRSSRNIAHFEVKRADDVTAYDVLRYSQLLVTKTALKKILKRVL